MGENHHTETFTVKWQGNQHDKGFLLMTNPYTMFDDVLSDLNAHQIF